MRFSPERGVLCLASQAYIVGFIDSLIYVFLPWWTTVLLRLVQGRPWLHRVAGRSVLIGDIPWVAQSVEAFTSKLFALSYSSAPRGDMSQHDALGHVTARPRDMRQHAARTCDSGAPGHVTARRGDM